MDLAGDEFADAYQYIYVPEEWEREERSSRTLPRIFSIGCSAILGLAIFAGAIAAIVNWSRRKFSVKAFLCSLGVFLLLSLINLANNWLNISSQFSTAQPFKNQVLVFILGGLVSSLFIAAAVALVIGMVHYWNQERPGTGGPGILVKGFALGMLVAGLSSAVSRLGPESDPIWASYDSASAVIPVLAGSLRPISSLILSATVLLLVIGTVNRFSKNWTHKKGVYSVLLVLMGVVLAGTGGIDSILFWLASGFITGVVLLLLFIYMIRFEWGLVPLAVGALSILSQIKIVLLDAHPASVPGGIVATLLLMCVAAFWSRTLTRKTRLGIPLPTVDQERDDSTG